MELNEYQDEAQKTDQTPAQDGHQSQLISVLGLAGRAGALSTEYLRELRDGSAYVAFHQKIAETLGDLLWYVANIATRNGLPLEAIARQNLAKTSSRWGRGDGSAIAERSLDEGFPSNERFPRVFTVEVSSSERSDGAAALQLTYEGRKFGDALTDNSETDDGYRFHDIFHLAFVAHLGWSPVFRGRLFFNCKRKSSASIDEVEDGGRAAVIDEAIAALIFNEAKKNSFYEGVNNVSFQLLQLIVQLTSHLEVHRCTMAQWETAILNAFEVWRHVRDRQSGRLVGNLDVRSLQFFQ